MRELITHSRLDTFKTCRKKHWFSYEQKIRRVDDAKALRMGSAHHEAIELLATGNSIEAACEAIYKRYQYCPANTEEMEWRYEEETLVRLACGYAWRWQNDELRYHAVEQSFRLRLNNPETGKPTPSFDLGGKIDGIVELNDGRLAVKESKLYGEDIGTDSHVWKRMKLDHQVTLYVLAARRLGYEVDTVLYDVTRKPTIKPTDVPILDGDGLKVVVDAAGDRVKNSSKDTWRQTADKEKGYAIVSRPMSTTEWGEKLANDIAERPDFYFSRVEIPRLQQDLDQFEVELWDMQQMLRDAQLKERWYRTVNKNTCQFCDAFDLCCQNWQPGESLPEWFQILGTQNPELEPPSSQEVTTG